MSKRVLSLTLIFTFIATVLVAQHLEADSTKQQALSEFIVTANRAASDKFTTPEAIDLLDKKQLQRFRPRTTPEILLTMPGVFVQKTNHGGGSPFVRGLTGNQLLLLLDGIRLNNATYRYGPNQYLNTVDALSLERVEILRGSGSVPFGSDALGGTIQVFTQNIDFQEQKTWSGTVLGRLWSQGMEQSGRASLGFSSKKVAVHGGFTYRNFGDLVGGDSTGVQTPSGYSEYAFDLKSKFLIGRQTTLTVAHNEVQQNHAPVYHKVQLENFKRNEFELQLRRLSYARLEGKTESKWCRKWYIIASRQQTAEGRISQKNASTTRRDERDDVETFGLTSTISSELSNRWTVNSGLEMYHDAVGSTRRDVNLNDGSAEQKRGLYPNHSSMLNVAAFSMHEFDLHPWKLLAGIRLNGYQIRVSDEALGKVTLTPAAVVWNAAAQRRLGQKANVFLSYHAGFRAPNIDDLGTLGIVDFRYEVPNYTLRPERSHNVQLGFKYQNKRLRSETYLFRNELRDLIARVKTPDSIQGYPVYQKENIERAYIQGIESQWSLRVSPKFFLDGHLAYTFGQNLTKQEPVRRIPPFNGRLALRFQPSQRWFTAIEWLTADAQHRLAQGDRDDNRIPLGGTPGWSVFNVQGGFDWKWLHLQLSVHNLFDQDYRLHGSGVNAVGRSVVLTAECVF
jgi:hemoglobin/transferrin/lactoferrin receptor protein